MRGGVLYTLVAGVVALVVGWVGSSLTSGAGRTGVWVGAGAALALQILVFWALFVWLLPHRRMLAHGLGVAGRFLVVGIMALVWVPLVGLPLAPTLFSLVTVFFVTTLVEPLFLQAVLPAASSDDAAPSRTRR